MSWLGRPWSWSTVAWTTLFLDESGSDNLGPGREWLGQPRSWTRVAWTTVALDEAGPDKFGLDKVGWTSFNWMICPVPDSMAESTNHHLSLAINVALLTVLTTYSLFLPFSPVQAYRGEHEGLANSDLPPISISGACLVLVYTPQQTFKSKEWTTKFSAHSWSNDVSVAIFNQNPS